jgi:hypothetical protein
MVHEIVAGREPGRRARVIKPQPSGRFRNIPLGFGCAGEYRLDWQPEHMIGAAVPLRYRLPRRGSTIPAMLGTGRPPKVSQICIATAARRSSRASRIIVPCKGHENALRHRPGLSDDDPRR